MRWNPFGVNRFDEKDEYSKTNIGDIFDGGAAYSGYDRSGKF